MRELGADETIDYTTPRFEDVARNIDIVLDPLPKKDGRRFHLTRPRAVPEVLPSRQFPPKYRGDGRESMCLIRALLPENFTNVDIVLDDYR